MENQLTYLVLVYFIYGLAFFSMGLAVWLEAGRTSGFENIRALRFLAGFGFLHGLHEWVEVFTILHNAGVVECRFAAGFFFTAAYVWRVYDFCRARGQRPYTHYPHGPYPFYRLEHLYSNCSDYLQALP